MGNKRFLVIYGKGGIGKTTVTTNLAEALQERGHRVMLVGCSPKSSLVDVYGLGGLLTPLLDLKRQEGIDDRNISRAVWSSERGLILTETGGPEPGIGCAGVGLPTAFAELQSHAAAIAGIEEVDYTLYDVIGDVVCGGFATPMRGGQRDVIVVTSGELMSLYAANNLARACRNLASAGTDVKVVGLVANNRGVEREGEILAAFAERTAMPILATIPRDPTCFKLAELKGGTVVQHLPDSEIAQIFRDLARHLDEDSCRIDPKPIEDYNELFTMFMGFQTGSSTSGAEVGSSYRQRIPQQRVQRSTPKRISLYGTGGIGKSTTASNVSAALVLLGETVYQVGCDPKRDSIATLCGELKPTLLEAIKARGSRAVNLAMLKELTFAGQGYEERLYGTECGGPTPGKGCAGKGVDLALKHLETYRIVATYGFTFVLYDVLGDTVCGGFATPLKFAPQTYIVTSGETATMTQAMKIAQSVHVVGHRGVDVAIAGVINNMRGIPQEREIVEEVFGAVGLPVVAHIPRSSLVQEAENLRRTVVQTFPESPQAQIYMELARHLRDSEERHFLSRDILTAGEVQEIVNRYA